MERSCRRHWSLVLLFLACISVSPVVGLSATGNDAADVLTADNDEAKKFSKQAEKLLRRGDLTGAEAAFRKALTLEPANARHKLRLAFTLLKQRRIADAYKLSFAVANEDHNNAYAFAVLGAVLLNAGRFNDARQIFYSAISLNKKEDLAWAGLGLLDFYENKIETSLDNLSEAVYYEPNEPDYLFAYAQVASRAERYREAASSYERFLAVSKNTDDERRARIRGLIKFLQYLGGKPALYETAGQERTSVPFELKGNRPIIQLRVNNRPQPLNFVLDTGSGISVISNETAERLGIGAITRGGFARGIGGDGRFEIVYGFLRQVDIGDVKVRNVPVYIRKFHSDAGNVDGYIGLALISKFLTTIDYGDQTFSLVKKDAVEGSPAADGSLSLPLRLTSSGFLSGQVRLAGIEQPLNFIVDTGATVSVISDQVANLEPISTAIREEKMRVIGSAGVTEGVSSFMLPSVSFGSHSRKDVEAIALDLGLINEASGFEQAGILGGNFLRNFRMTFDFKNSKVTFIPVAENK